MKAQIIFHLEIRDKIIANELNAIKKMLNFS